MSAREFFDVILLYSWFGIALFSFMWLVLTIILKSKKKFRKDAYMIFIVCVTPVGAALPILAIVLGFAWLMIVGIPKLLKIEI